MPTKKKSTQPPPANKKLKDSTLSEDQASRVKGGRISSIDGGSGDPENPIP